MHGGSKTKFMACYAWQLSAVIRIYVLSLTAGSVIALHSASGITKDTHTSRRRTCQWTWTIIEITTSLTKAKQS